MTPAEILALFAAGTLAAIINTVAGAGSLISLRVLMLLGVPAVIANGTNRLPVLVQSTVAWLGFRRAGVDVDAAELRRAIGWSGLGSVFGAIASSFVPEEAMRTILIFVLFGVAVVSLVGLRKKPTTTTAEGGAPPAISRAYPFWLFVSGAYGGFLQAGVGLLLLYTLMDVRGLDALRANLIKAGATAVYAVIALAIFAGRSQIDLPKALALSAGAFAGALLGVRFAARYAGVLRYVAVIADFVACAVLLWREWATR